MRMPTYQTFSGGSQMWECTLTGKKVTLYLVYLLRPLAISQVSDLNCNHTGHGSPEKSAKPKEADLYSFHWACILTLVTLKNDKLFLCNLVNVSFCPIGLTSNNKIKKKCASVTCMFFARKCFPCRFPSPTSVLGSLNQGHKFLQ